MKFIISSLIFIQISFLYASDQDILEEDLEQKKIDKIWDNDINVNQTSLITKMFHEDPIKAGRIVSGLSYDSAIKSVINLGIMNNRYISSINDSVYRMQYGSIYNIVANESAYKALEKIIEKYEKKIENNLKEISNKIQQLKDTMKEANKIKEKKVHASDETLKHLANVYSSIPPKYAAKLLDKIDNEIILKLYEHIDKDQFAIILSSMDPEKVNELTSSISKFNV